MKTYWIGLKDLMVTVRDRKALLILVAMPLLLIAILGMALGPAFSSSPEIARIDVGFVDLDQGQVSRQLKEGLSAERVRKVLRLHVIGEAQARREIRLGDLAAAIVLPADFSEKIRDGKRSYITVLGDPGQALQASIVRSIAGSIATDISSFQAVVKTGANYVGAHRLFFSGIEAKVRAAKKLENLKNLKGKGLSKKEKDAKVRRFIDDLVKRLRDAPDENRVTVVKDVRKASKEVNSLQYYSAGMAVMFVLFSAMYGAFSLITERDTATLARLMSSPTSRLSILGGKLMGTAFVGTLQFAVLVTSTRLIFGVDWGGAWGAIAALMMTTVFAATGMSVFIAAVGKSVRSASGIAQILIQSMSALGGSMIPIMALPGWLQQASKLTINNWAITGFLKLMEGGGFEAVLPSLGALLVIGTFFFALGTWRLRYE